MGHAISVYNYWLFILFLFSSVTYIYQIQGEEKNIWELLNTETGHLKEWGRMQKDDVGQSTFKGSPAVLAA